MARRRSGDGEVSGVIIIKRVHPAAKLPEYKTDGAAGMDLYACLDGPLVLRAHEWRSVPTGIALTLPTLTEGQVRPRSGLAAQRGVTVLNAPGTIDPDFTGEVRVLLINHSDTDYRIDHGDRIAQLVVADFRRYALVEVDDLPVTARGDGGFGSTGR